MSDKAAKGAGEKRGGDKARLVSLHEHPQAGPSIRRVKAFGGLGGFAIALLNGLGGGTPFATTLLHGLEFGVVGNLVAWAAAVVVWKRVLSAQAVAAVRARDRRVAEARTDAATE